ncbi:unnamed protein product [Schistosoma turkestanicum]|nr:unnamed protein product [Schistosoma turkestanicum]
MELLIQYILDILLLKTWSFGEKSEENLKGICQNACIYNSTVWKEPHVISSFVLIVIAITLALTTNSSKHCTHQL